MGAGSGPVSRPRHLQPREGTKLLADLYVATESFACRYNGLDITIVGGQTLVREGHELLDLYPNLFRLATADFEVEQATADPGEKRRR